MKINESYLERRRFLSGMLGGGAAALGAGVTAPLVHYAANLRDEPPPDFLKIDRADWDLPAGKSKMLMYGGIPALLIKPRGGDGKLKVFVAICTHLDCTVGYKEDDNCIFCACHEGYYDVDGRVRAGPPPKPLRKFYHELRDGTLVIALEEENLEKAIEEPDA
ncbi:MAG: ubiquinol-cytochrome c reductase iron-sulfur subunit [Planctomycetota bacterium]